MNKAIIIGIIVLAVIGVVFGLAQVNESSVEPIKVVGGDGKSKNYTIDLTESVGVRNP